MIAHAEVRSGDLYGVRPPYRTQDRPLPGAAETGTPISTWGQYSSSGWTRSAIGHAPLVDHGAGRFGWPDGGAGQHDVRVAVVGEPGLWAAR